MKWTSNGFLTICGPLIFAIGLAGFFGLIGENWRVTEAENLLRSITGFVMLVAGLTLPAATQKKVAILFGIVTLGMALYIISATVFVHEPLTEPASLIMYALIGTWALAVSVRRSSVIASIPSEQV